MSIQTLTNYFLEYGAFFIFLIVLLEYLNLPGFPAGVIMPLSGIWASQGEISFPLVMVLTVAAGLTGSWALYWLGRAGGDKVLGFYFRKFPKQKEAVESKIDMLREKGSVGGFVSKLLPMVRTIISIPAGMWRKKLIWFAKETVIPEYMKWFTNKCDLIFAPTPGMQNRIRENGTEVSMAVLPTGLDDSFYIEDEEKTKTIRRQYLGEEKNGHLFCSVSRLEEEKNPIFLLNGIRCLKEKLPFSFRVLLLGEGSMRKELEVLAEQMGLSDTVVFLGNISNEDVKQYLYASELFLFASKSETQGIVLEEAMAAGNPIVAVRASGVEDVVKNGINGYMTEEDVEIWSDKAAELIQSPDYRQVCMEARKTAESYRASRLAAHAETLYRQCMERKEEMRYEEHTKSGKEHSAASVFRLFKTS